MTTHNPTGWCPRCQQNVLLKREEIDACLAIILLIFTAGIGLIIYLAIYYSHPEENCIHCGTKITAIQYPTQPSYQSSPPQSTMQNISPEQVKGAPANFCALCGEKLDIGAKFCQNCGSQISED
ncbi:MAG: zinc-ribbon domain-containing protein [Promethearchaeota archaeon]